MQKRYRRDSKTVPCNVKMERSSTLCKPNRYVDLAKDGCSLRIVSLPGGESVFEFLQNYRLTLIRLNDSSFRRLKYRYIAKNVHE